MLSDNRCARKVQELRDDMLSDFEDLRAMPAFIWETLASLLSVPPEVLQDNVLSAATIAQGYIEHKVLSVCESYPGKLLHGSLEANLDELLSLEVVPEEQGILKREAGASTRVVVSSFVHKLPGRKNARFSSNNITLPPRSCSGLSEESCLLPHVQTDASSHVYGTVTPSTATHQTRSHVVQE
eukprot:4026625-Amphidinium_carterae.1